MCVCVCVRCPLGLVHAIRLALSKFGSPLMKWNPNANAPARGSVAGVLPTPRGTMPAPAARSKRLFPPQHPAMFYVLTHGSLVCPFGDPIFVVTSSQLRRNFVATSS